MINKTINRLKQIKDRLVFKIKTISLDFLSKNFFYYGKKEYAVHLENDDLCISRRERFSLKDDWEFAYIFAERSKLIKLYEIFKNRNFATIKNDKIQYACILAELFKNQYMPPDLFGFNDDDVYEIYVIAQLERENGIEDRVRFSLNNLTDRKEGKENKHLSLSQKSLIKQFGELFRKKEKSKRQNLNSGKIED